MPFRTRTVVPLCLLGGVAIVHPGSRGHCATAHGDRRLRHDEPRVARDPDPVRPDDHAVPRKDTATLHRNLMSPNDVRPSRVLSIAVLFCWTVRSADAQTAIVNEAAGAAAARIDAFFRRAAAFGQFDGAVLVAQQGRIVYERAFGEANREWHVPNTIDTRFEIASMTKAMTAIMVMQLVEERKVRLDGHVSDYLPFYPRETGSHHHRSASHAHLRSAAGHRL